MAGILQIGYRAENGTPSLTGDINIMAPLAVNTTNTPSLLLVTGGSVTQSAGAIISALVPTSPPSTPPALSLGVIAGESVVLGEANRADTLAGFDDGIAASFRYRNQGTNLTIGALPLSTVGVSFAAGIPSYKPTEVFALIPGKSNKAAIETWRRYAPLFWEYSTASISPELLAALAQVESAGNPIRGPGGEV